MNTFNIERAVIHMENYIKSYRSEPSWEAYREKTFIEDMLYGIGLSLSEQYRYSDGFSEFKKKLINEGYYFKESNQ